MLNSKTQLNMVIGHPLVHTQSPLLHNTAYDLLNVNAVMLAHANHNLAAIMQALQTLAVQLIAVTMPYKEEILQYLDGSGSEVEQLKAANTVICRNGKFFGYNTDIDGVAYALRQVVITNKKVLILGAGGAARALGFYLQKNKANLLWLNRTFEHAQNLARLFGGKVVDSNDFHALQDVDIIINTTPLGMYPNVNDTPIRHYQFKSYQTIFDMVYNPIDTKLIKEARAKGATCISGLDMFIGQGLRQIELWLDKTINKEVMIDTIKTNLIKTQNTDMR